MNDYDFERPGSVQRDPLTEAWPSRQRENCGYCGATDAMVLVPSAPEGATGYESFAWVRPHCNVCGREGWAFPLDPTRPCGKACFLGMHKWRAVGELGVWRYHECRHCGKRTESRRYSGCYSPSHSEWLMGAPWSFERDRKIPPPSPAAKWNKVAL